MIDTPVLSAERLREAAAVRPSERQWEWQKTEFYGFIHFGMNTMTNREWGEGHEDPALFDPASVDTDQWADALVSAGMRGVILTCKHHDGFALWPSAHSSHTVAASPWRDGKGDLVAEMARSCRERGLKFGVYLSPWDRTEASYGSGEGYDDFFVAQLTELLTGYGDIFSVWFDGANGEGPDGRKQFYDWDRYYALVRELQPGAVINVCGPDVRWCGNEAGSTRENEWSVVPASLRDAERTADRSQKQDDGEFSRAVKSDEEDLGSRAALAASDQPFVWYPSEVNTSIRPGWFHHPAEDSEVRSPEELFEIYRRSVGGNATFLLNLPPDARGLISAPDLASLAGLGELIAARAAAGIVSSARIEFSSQAVTPAELADLTPDSVVWRPHSGDAEPSLDFSWDSPRTLTSVSIKEHVPEGQLIERVEVRVSQVGGPDVLVAAADSVGYLRILDFDAVVTDRLSVVVTARRGTLAIAGVEVHAGYTGV